jgi:hypothetical protein
MAKHFPALEDEHRAFIEKQKIFFVASAAPEGRVNLSPKGMDSLRVISPHRVAYLDLTGSGNETSAHVEACGRMTMMFCAFEGAPLILRLYGKGAILRKGTPDYEALLAHFVEITGARQIVRLDIDLVQTSCGYAVPFFDYREDRPNLVRWAENKGADGLEAYRKEKNTRSIDGLPTGWPG